ncbi:MAG: UbiA family prenyltransferase [Flavobacteriales bacterium AspAUS03]
MVGLFAVLRGYNLFLLLVAQYLAAYFVFGGAPPLKKFLYDSALHLLILASTCSVAAGYLINNFYDSEKDSIHEPFRVRIYYFVGHGVVFRLYLLLNLLALGYSVWVSWKALVFFLLYQFGIWLYSHKISRMALWNNLTATILTVMPFFILLVRYQNFRISIFVYACFLFLLLLIKDVLKDLSTQRGDLLFDYYTLPLKYGEKVTKYVVSVLIIFFIFNALLLSFYVKERLMKYYFFLSALFVGISLTLLWGVHSEKYYRLVLAFYTVLIFLGVCCISLMGVEYLNLQKCFP